MESGGQGGHIGAQLHIGKPRNQLREDRFQLHARECGADAVAQAVAEPDVGRAGARQVDPVRVGEGRRVMVGRSGVEQDEVAGPDRDPVDVDVLPGIARNADPARHPGPQEFLDGLRDLVRRGQQRLPLLAMGEQQQGLQPDLHHRRLVPGEQQLHTQRRHLEIGEVGFVTQPRDDVIAGLGTFDGDEFQPVLEQGGETVHRRGVVRGERGRLDPDPEAVPVGIRHAEQIADHQHWKRLRQARVQVGRWALLLHVVKHCGAELFDLRLQLAHVSGGEVRL